MKVLKRLSAALLWIVGALLGLVAVVLCVTVVLLPVGIPLLMLARCLLGTAVRLMMPRSLAHPVDDSSRRLRKKGRELGSNAQSLGRTARKTVRKRSGDDSG